MTGLYKITDKILGDARADADRILAEADARAAEIGADYRSRAQALRRSLDDEARRSAEELVARAKADAVTLRKRAAEQARADMVEQVFATAYRQVQELPEEHYLAFLTDLACYAVATETGAVSGEDVLLLCERDRDRYGKALMANLKAAHQAGRIPSCPALSDGTANIDGGLILCRGDMELNASLAALFSELRRDYEARVRGRLFAERRG